MYLRHTERMKHMYNIKFGISKDIITPKIRTTMLGFGSVFGKEFTAIHDDLYVKCLILEDGGQVLIFISLDLCFHDESLPEAIRDYIGEKYGVKRDNFLISYTHTHFGPTLKGYDFVFHSREYEDFLIGRIKDSIDRAFLNMYEGSIEYTHITGEWNISRRVKENGKVTAGITPSPDGECDKNLYLLKLTDSLGNIKVLGANFACHPSNGDRYTVLTSEYPGRLCHLIEAELYGCTAMFFQGFGGDSKLKMGAKSSKFHPITYEEINEVASSMVLRIKEALYGNDWLKIKPSLSSKMFKIKMPLDPYPLSFFQEELKLYSGGKNIPFDKSQVKGPGPLTSYLYWSNAEYVVNNYDQMEDFIMLNCGVVRLGEGFYIFTVGGEPSIDVKNVLKPLVPDDTLLCFGYNDAIAYVPSDKMLKEGGYEAGDSSVTEYRMKGKFKMGIDNLFREGFRRALDVL